MTLSALGIFSAAGAGGVPAGPPVYELISTTILGSTQSDLTFSNLGDWSSTYKHLQMRIVLRASKSAGDVPLIMQLNGNTTTNYRWKFMSAYSGAVSSTSGGADNGIYFGNPVPGATAASNIYAPAVIDILDAYSTTKNKTIRSLTGGPTSTPSLLLNSGALFNTASVTSVRIYPDTGGWVAGSRFSIYGVKG